ncbi:MAG: hypothetical protein H7A51_08715 [Akkermansiaceae bacterium]|nr:hypothetical protein [Akkermansiaceae bacterium]
MTLTCALLIAFSGGRVAAEPQPLSEADRIALEEQLKKIQQQSEDRVGGLFSRAIQDYRSAIQSDDATMDLYLKCYEKVRFTDEKRKASEFRDWKRKNKDRLNSSSMRMALRHQLAWLLLSIEAARRDGDISEMGKRAIDHLDQIMKHAEVLKEHRAILSQNALGSVFAQAYSLNIKVEDWPQSAMDIAQIYNKVVLPPLRKPDRIDSLRAAWQKRILHEGYVVEKWNVREGSTIGKKDAMQPPELEKFLSEKRPQLLWQMEMDCFKAGDQRASALRMLKHLETYLTHQDAPQWIEEFQALINPPKEPAAGAKGGSE